MKRLLSMSGAALLAACSASLPPPELVDARAAYARAESGPAAKDAPDALGAAKVALDHAERTFRAHGDTPHARTLAYVASRKAETATVAARVAEKQTEARTAEEEITRLDRDRLRSGVRPPRDTSEALVYTAGALTREHVAREESGDTPAATIDKLRKVVHVKDEGNGFVVTFSGPDMFRGDGSKLEDGSLAKLDALATAIARAAPNAAIRIESHADTGAGDYYDRGVAQRRANAIADYLAQHGVARAHIRPIGYAPRHVPREAADYVFRGLDRSIHIVVYEPVALATSKL